MAQTTKEQKKNQKQLKLKKEKKSKIVFPENVLSLSLLRCGPDNKRTKEKRKTIKIKETRKFEKQNKTKQKVSLFILMKFF